MSVQEFTKAPQSQSCRLIAFDDYQIIRCNPPVLVVSGQAPCLNMEVSLQPLIFVRCPEFWGIEVVGCLPGAICLTAIKPFKVSISLAGIIGSQGIEIMGSNKSEKVKIKGGCDSGLKPDIAV